jgi:hypothetical protein
MPAFISTFAKATVDKSAFAKASDFACATPDKTADKFW